jgi:hypothetical protein
MLLLFSCMIGLLLLLWGRSTSLIVILSLAFIIFCFFSDQFLGICHVRRYGDSLAFWLVRYVIIPVIAILLLRDPANLCPGAPALLYTACSRFFTGLFQMAANLICLLRSSYTAVSWLFSPFLF